MLEVRFALLKHKTLLGLDWFKVEPCSGKGELDEVDKFWYFVALSNLVVVSRMKHFRAQRKLEWQSSTRGVCGRACTAALMSILLWGVIAPWLYTDV